MAAALVGGLSATAVLAFGSANSAPMQSMSSTAFDFEAAAGRLPKAAPSSTAPSVPAADFTPAGELAAGARFLEPASARDRLPLYAALSDRDRLWQIAVDVDRGLCTREGVQVLETELLRNDSEPRLTGGLSFLLAEAWRCLHEDELARAYYYQAAQLNPALRVWAWRRMKRDNLAVLGDTPPTVVELAASLPRNLDQLMAPEDAGSETAAAWAAELARTAPSRELTHTVDDVLWRLSARPWEERTTERLRWLRERPDHESAPRKFMEALEATTPELTKATTAAATDARDWWLSVGFDVALGAARTGRSHLARRIIDGLAERGLLRPEEGRRGALWLSAASAEGRPAWARARLAELATGQDRIAAEAEWLQVLLDRKVDRDTAAADRAARLAARFPYDRRVDTAEVCVRLADLTDAPEQRIECWRRFLDSSGRVPTEELVDLAVIGAVDSLATRRLDDARVILRETAEIVEGLPEDPRLHYWIGRTHEELGETDLARAAYERAFVAGPVSYYGLLADEHLAPSPESRKFGPLVRRLFSGQTEALRAEQTSVARELLALGLASLAREEIKGQTHLFGHLSPETCGLTAELVHQDGEPREALSWMMRHCFVFRVPMAELTRISPLAWSAAYPTPFLKEARMAETASGVPASVALAFARRESKFDPRARSPVDARGLMQVKPATARFVQSVLPDFASVGISLWDPATNMILGNAYLSWLERRQGPCLEVLAAAYSVGHNKVENWIDSDRRLASDLWLERIPYPTIRDYARDMVLSRAVYSVLLGDALPPSMCVVPELVER